MQVVISGPKKGMQVVIFGPEIGLQVVNIKSYNGLQVVNNNFGTQAIMLKRKALNQIKEWKSFRTKQALLVSGARQVGKTFLIRQFIHEEYESSTEINLIESPDAAEAFSSAKNADDLFLRITAFSEADLVPGNSAIFIDEMQECAEIATMLKFLVDKYGHDYDFIVSGSLLGVELREIRSIPVGYLQIIQMYPLDLEEFCWANNVPTHVLREAQEAYTKKRPVDPFVDQRLSDIFHNYIIVGGMPDAVQAFVDNNNLQQVRTLQNSIINTYRHDISQYARDRQRQVRRIFDLIPSELNTQSKRFALSHIEEKSRFSKYDNDFAWLIDAGVAIPVYNVNEPSYPLELAMDSSFFKLFLSDVGLLTCMCGMDVVRNLLIDRVDINYGSIYENFVAQELSAHELCHPAPAFHLFFYRSRKFGELDFLFEQNGCVVPIEVKSGKNYKRHCALSAVMDMPAYGIKSAIVLHEGNIETKESITYLPMYMTMFLGQKFL